MAINPQTHVRSISLPSRLPSNNPTNSEFQLKNLKSLKNIITGPTSSEDIQSGLLKLAQLYNSVQELTQFSASQHNLDASMEFIDSCATIREMLQMIKENVQSLQSAIRRKGLESSSIQEDIASYLFFRKKMNKNLSKSLKNLKNLENTPLVNTEHNDLIMALREAISIFRSTLMYLSCPTVGNSGGWNLITKLMIRKSESTCERDQFVTSEVGKLDCALAGKVVDGQMVQRRLQNVESCIEGLESGVEKFYREMIGCRVKILNNLVDY